MVELPDPTRAIDEKAFQECQVLEIISLPEGLESIDDATFSHCSSL